MVSQSLSRLA
jgi:hypothetical protein